MANISLDFSNNALFQKNKITKTYTYKDIGTDNLKLYKVYLFSSKYRINNIRYINICKLGVYQLLVKVWGKFLSCVTKINSKYYKCIRNNVYLCKLID